VRLRAIVLPGFLALVPTVTAAQAPPATSPPPATPAKKQPAPGWTTEPFTIRNEVADFRVGLTGYLQADFRDYHDWTVAEPDLRAPDAEWRRLRFGIDGRYKRVSFEVDFAAVFDAKEDLKDAWAELRIVRALRIRGGHLKIPVSPEWMTSQAKQDFLERAVIVDSLAPGRDWGGEILGDLGRFAEYQAGVFAGDGDKQREHSGTTFAGRLLLKPWRWLAFGGSTSYGQVTADPAGPDLDPAPKGFSASSLTQYQFFAPLFVEGRRRRWDAEAEMRHGPVSLRGEYLEQREQRKGQGPTLEDLPDVRGRGFQVAATWLVTGEKKTRTIRPERRLFRGPGGIGLGVRYEEMRSDDVRNEGFEGFGNRAGNIRPAGFRAVTGGLSWWPTVFMRLMGDIVVERYEDPLRAPQTGKEGNYVSLLGRVQVMLP